LAPVGLKSSAGILFLGFWFGEGFYEQSIGAVRVTQVEEAVSEIVQGLTGLVEAFAQGGEDRGQLVALRQPVIAGDAVAGAAQAFVVAQVWKTFHLGAMADALRENAGEE